MPYLTPSGGQPATIPRRSKAATDTFRASRDPQLTTRPAHYLPSSLKPLTASNESSASASPAGGPSGVGSASGRPRSRSDLTPRPTSTGSGGSPRRHQRSVDSESIDHLSSALQDTSLGEKGHAPEGVGEDTTRRDSTPSLSSHAASASSVSVQSLGGGSDHEEGDSTPATSVGISHTNSDDAVMMDTPGTREGRDEAVRRYMQQLYAFHRKLYDEAKSDADGSSRKGSFSQFGEKKSGMAKLAAKKALASKLNS